MKSYAKAEFAKDVKNAPARMSAGIFFILELLCRFDRANVLLSRLLVGGRIEGDDEAMADYLAWQANGRDADIRAEPRPAARGRRGPQKRPAWRHRRATP